MRKKRNTETAKTAVSKFETAGAIPSENVEEKGAFVLEAIYSSWIC
jgi:hypothetical protein